MEWRFQRLNQTCAVSGEAFEVGDEVACYLYRGESGELQRVDLRVAVETAYQPPANLLGRWQRVVKPRGDEEKEAREQELLTVEEMFLSLMENPAPDADTANLQQILALMLERKRILRPNGPVQHGRQRYIHTKTKRELEVPMHEVTPEQVISLQQQIAQLL